MRLKVINSGSIGNAYLLETKDSSLLIEAGVKFQEIQKAADFDLLKIKACIVTHEHMDHAKGLKSVMHSGIPIIASPGTFDALNISKEQRDVEIRHSGSVTLNGWTIHAFTTQHDAKEPLGFIIEKEEIGRVLFITDSYLLKWNLSKYSFDFVIIEANYCEEIVKQIQAKRGDDYVNKRRFNSHMSIQTTIETLSRLNRSQLKQIVLIHLSDAVSHERDFKKQVEDLFGVPTTIATPGVEINFSKNQF